ncbi:hypothetical protein BRD10_04575 [Halobacteriales archaeon SW_12_71_31]|nr:MAG: hypothetical protein BRD10_04575 [Halobacteriales archaeon SW_12_71_31]
MVGAVGAVAVLVAAVLVASYPVLALVGGLVGVTAVVAVAAATTPAPRPAAPATSRPTETELTAARRHRSP